MEARSRSLPRRLHAISGLVPVGGFLAFHLYSNAAALRGADAYDRTARRLQELPLALVLEVVLLFAPLIFHAVYGLFLMAEEPAGSGSGRRPLAIFQRATGILVFVFILFHLWTTRLVQIHDHESLDLFRVMQALWASPWIRAFYVAGLLAATSHFSAGLWSVADDWGLARTRPARVAAAVLAAAVFAALSAIGLRSLAAFRL
ncbi:MAG TPA: succinate dehydrogenase [Thermoanaerobaculia bacterium]|jgi:succinate dehydrogenase / fumarate reductase cytochrome b subunit